jgi:hypothetical protein
MARQAKFKVYERNLCASERTYPLQERHERGPRGLINRKSNLVVCVDTKYAGWKCIAKCNTLAQAASVANAAHCYAHRNDLPKRYKVG